jgi:DNA-binding NarL/FixJ family response regulator
MGEAGLQVDAEVLRVLVIDDHEIFTELLSTALNRERDLVSVGHAATAEAGIEHCRRTRPDVVIMDVQLPDLDGLVATERVIAVSPWTRVVVLTAHATPEFMARAAAAGACAFLPKDGALSVLLDAVRFSRRGSLTIAPGLVTAGQPVPTGVPVGAGAPIEHERVEPKLTPRERDVLGLMAQGKDVRGIGAELSITPSTCRTYVKAVLGKLGAHSQLEAVVVAARQGLVELDGAAHG